MTTSIPQWVLDAASEIGGIGEHGVQRTAQIIAKHCRASDRYRAALVALVGSDDPKTLRGIRAYTVQYAPNETAILNAIDLLLE
jgi:hypothetical protein